MVTCESGETSSPSSDPWRLGCLASTYWRERTMMASYLLCGSAACSGRLAACMLIASDSLQLEDATGTDLLGQCFDDRAKVHGASQSELYMGMHEWRQRTRTAVFYCRRLSIYKTARRRQNKTLPAARVRRDLSFRTKQLGDSAKWHGDLALFVVLSCLEMSMRNSPPDYRF